jgi:hypothetical protein
VLGGSCTGVFAAVRAARMGAHVAIVERMGCFGGVATLSLVNVWHSPLDEIFERQIFAGLTVEVMDRLAKRGAVRLKEKSWHFQWAFTPAELQIELDALVSEAGVIPHLHTLFVAPHVSEGHLQAVVIEDKSGRRAIRAGMFIDATGDGDLARRLGSRTYHNPGTQPSTTCAIIGGWQPLMMATGRKWCASTVRNSAFAKAVAGGVSSPTPRATCSPPPAFTKRIARKRILSPAPKWRGAARSVPSWISCENTHPTYDSTSRAGETGMCLDMTTVP